MQKSSRGGGPLDFETEINERLKGEADDGYVGNAGDTTIQVTEGSGASMVILIAMIILFGGAAYFTGRLYGKVGMYAIIAGFFSSPAHFTSRAD